MQDLRWTSIDFKVRDKSILSDCWGSVPAGKVCAILGPSGAGKVIFFANLANDGCEILTLFLVLSSHLY